MCPGWWVGRRGCCLLGLLLLHALLLLTTTTKAAAAAALPAPAPTTTTIPAPPTLSRPWDDTSSSSFQTFYSHGLILPLRGAQAQSTTPLPRSIYYPTYQYPSGDTWVPRARRPPPELEIAGEVSAPPAKPSLRHSGEGGRGGGGTGEGDPSRSSGGKEEGVGEEEEEVVVVRWGEGGTAGGGGGGVPPIGPTLAPPEVTPLDLVRNTRSTPTNLTRNFRHHHKYRYQLYNENSRRVIKLLTDGNVKSTDDLTDPHTLLYLHPIHRGVLEIRSEATGLFLCMNNKGKLYASCNLSTECEFMGQLEDTYYDTLQSRHFEGRYIAIATNGRIKRARRLRGPLGKEHFFLSRKVQLEEVYRIIERYHRRLGQRPPQRCAGYNEYNMTSSSSDEGGRAGANAVTAPTPQVSHSTTVRPARCKIIKGRKKCRKRRKRCKSKKCRERRKRRKKAKKDCRKRVKGPEVPEVTTTPAAVAVTGRQRSREFVVRRGGSRVRHRPQTNQFTDGLQRRNSLSVTTNSSLQARRPHRRRLHTRPSPSLTTPTPSSRSTPRLTSNPRRPRLGTTTTPPPLPFPSAPSSAHPNRVRHAHNARQQRRLRGLLKSPTSVTA